MLCGDKCLADNQCPTTMSNQSALCLIFCFAKNDNIGKVASLNSSDHLCDLVSEWQTLSQSWLNSKNFSIAKVSSKVSQAEEC